MAAGSLKRELQFDCWCQLNGFGVNAFRQVPARADDCFLVCWRLGAPQMDCGTAQHHTPQRPVWYLGHHSGYVLAVLDLGPKAVPDMLQMRARICVAIWPVRGTPGPDFGVKTGRMNFQICRMNFRMIFLGNAP